MSLFFKSAEVIPELNGINVAKNRSVFLDVTTKTPNFEKQEDGIKYKNYAGYPPSKKDVFEEKVEEKKTVCLKKFCKNLNTTVLCLIFRASFIVIANLFIWF